MTNSAPELGSDAWQLDDTNATLRCTEFSAQIDLLNPHTGLTKITCGDAAIDGSVLGIAPGSDAAIAQRDISDAYVRGSDLVVTYAETKERPFSLQVYWRATSPTDDVIVLDTILSLQTDLLESFPGVAVETHFPEGKYAEITMDVAQAQRAVVGTLFRATDVRWSYAEMTHPEDSGESEITHGENDQLHLRRQLGGHFLEKGVIRRLRVRGVFLPQEQDQEVAAKQLAGLITAEPPLTV